MIWRRVDFSIHEIKNVEVITVNQGNNEPKCEEELAKDLLKIITIFLLDYMAHVAIKIKR